MDAITSTPTPDAVADPRALWRGRVCDLIDAISGSPLEAPIPDVAHLFAEGIYARQQTLPAGYLLVGKVHLQGGFMVILSGDITIWDATGNRLRFGAGQVLAYPRGAQRVGFAHEETTLITFHATTETNVEVLERLLSADPTRELEVAQ